MSTGLAIRVIQIHSLSQTADHILWVQLAIQATLGINKACYFLVLFVKQNQMLWARIILDTKEVDLNIIEGGFIAGTRDVWLC